MTKDQITEVIRKYWIEIQYLETRDGPGACGGRYGHRAAVIVMEAHLATMP